MYLKKQTLPYFDKFAIFPLIFQFVKDSLSKFCEQVPLKCDFLGFEIFIFPAIHVHKPDQHVCKDV